MEFRKFRSKYCFITLTVETNIFPLPTFDLKNDLYRMSPKDDI